MQRISSLFQWVEFLLCFSELSYRISPLLQQVEATIIFLLLLIKGNVSLLCVYPLRYQTPLGFSVLVG